MRPVKRKLQGMGGDSMTLEEVAKVLGVSHQRVSQLEQSALKKVRIELLKRNITYEDLQLCLKLWF